MEFHLEPIARRPTNNYIRGYFVIHRDDDRIHCANIRSTMMSEGELIPFFSHKTPFELFNEWEFGEDARGDDAPKLVDNLTMTVEFNIGTEMVVECQIHVLDVTNLSFPGYFTRMLSRQANIINESLYGDGAILGWTSLEMSFDYYGIVCFEWMKEVMYWIYQYITVDESDPAPSQVINEFDLEPEDFSYGRFTTCVVKYNAKPCPVMCKRDYHVKGIKRVKIANRFHSLLEDPSMIAPLESILDMLAGESTKLDDQPIDPKRLMVLSAITAINNKRKIHDVDDH